MHKRARQRAADLGISLAEYLLRAVERDLGAAPVQGDPASVFDLGRSRRSDIDKDKDAMIAEAVFLTWRRRRR